jgi:SAM-dependent methyltransferase
MPQKPDTGDPIEPVIQLLATGAETGAWVRCIITPARGSAPFDRLVAQPVRLGRGPAIKLTTRSGKNETTATVRIEDWPARLPDLIGKGAVNLNVIAPAFEWHARRTRDGKWLVSKGRPSLQVERAPELPPHDRLRGRALSETNPRVQELFIETGLYGKNGAVLGEAVAKHRQVQHYLELLRPLPIWDDGTPLRVLDAGCGKAYLSLALYLWAELRRTPIELVGIDREPAIVAAVEQSARRLGYERANFQAAPIREFAAGWQEPVDLLVSLHACDTATDEALAAGVRLGARAIVLAPCCHQEIDDQVEARRKEGALPAQRAWAATLGSGLLRHRLTDIVTDSLRAAALEALGYDVDLVEFVSPEATARNLMIRAELRPAGNPARDAARAAYSRYRALADEWAVRPALEDLLGETWPPFDDVRPEGSAP